MATKDRLDQLLQKREPQYSRAQIQSFIMQGKVSVNGMVVTKAGTLVNQDVLLSYDFQKPKFVSRAGFKLEKALEHFNIDVTNLVCMDAGISTGGFTDCLLQHGAKKIYGIDVGYGQVHENVRNDSRVILLERTNLREVESVGELVDLVTLDLSFISVLKVMDAVNAVAKPQAQLIILIKPQFESQKHEIERGGLITDTKVHEAVVERVTKGVQAYGYTCKEVIESPLLGATGNKEFLAYFIRNN